MPRGATPKKHPPEPRGRLVFTVEYGKPRADKPGVTYSKKWLVRVSEEGRRGSSLWNSFQYKSKAVKYARKKAKQRYNRPSKLKVYKKNIKEISQETRYD